MYKENPHLEFHIFVCQNERPADAPLGSCFAKGSEALLLYMKTRARELNLEGIRINKAGCLGQCARGIALVVYPQGQWFQVKTKEDIDLILEQYIARHEG